MSRQGCRNHGRRRKTCPPFQRSHTNALKGVRSDVASPAAKTLGPSPKATDGAMCRHEARGGGPLGFDRRAGAVLLRRYSTGPVASPLSDRTRWPQSERLQSRMRRAIREGAE
jgi:hypothetical protein